MDAKPADCGIGKPYASKHDRHFHSREKVCKIARPVVDDVKEAGYLNSISPRIFGISDSVRATRVSFRLDREGDSDSEDETSSASSDAESDDCACDAPLSRRCSTRMSTCVSESDIQQPEEGWCKDEDDTEPIAECRLDSSSCAPEPVPVARRNSDSSSCDEVSSSCDEVAELVILTKPLALQAAGHQNSFLQLHSGSGDSFDSTPDFLLKAYNVSEHQAYEDMMALGSELHPFTAQCFGKVSLLHGQQFLKLSNLLAQLQKPHVVMDCKLGLRSFSEDEMTDTKPRSDLYQRLAALDPSFLSAAEHQARACTKYRWMKFNDEITSLSTLGFRIDGIVSQHEKIKQGTLHQARSLEENAEAIVQHFLPKAAFALAAKNEPHAEHERCLQVVASVRQQLQELFERMEASSFVGRHSMIGSSLLFAIDAEEPHARVFLVDFAKVTAVPSSCNLTHKRPWSPGNCEDGLMVGLQNMMQCWEMVEVIVRKSRTCL
eukprot:TRINITY_DN31128_c0_g1_i1.p1 TRINITY_DN31128_c0_g1~~TRINITY_DN31128_c0_g1_i1.p1  ORF type:complete len:518 (+),score=108.51 TRINITY_DN31128_c0_g1_i1:82-1554(+)